MFGDVSCMVSNLVSKIKTSKSGPPGMPAVMGGCGRGTRPPLGDWEDTEQVLLAWVRVCVWQEQAAFRPAEPEPSMVSLRQVQGFRGGALGKVGGRSQLHPISLHCSITISSLGFSERRAWVASLTSAVSLCPKS